jgi:hypothetical protein
MNLPHYRPAIPRREALRGTLPDTVNLLKQHRAGEIAEIDIDDYVALNWLEWNGGSLQLTVTGDNVCKQLRLR